MKKLTILSLFIVALSAFPFSSSFASVVADQTGSITLGGDSGVPTVDLSKNVHASYGSEGSSFTAATANALGSQAYLTGSWTTYIYYKDTTTVPTLTASMAAAPDSTWKAIGE